MYKRYVNFSTLKIHLVNFITHTHTPHWGESRMVTKATPGEKVTLGSEVDNRIWSVSAGEASHTLSLATRRERV